MGTKSTTKQTAVNNEVKISPNIGSVLQPLRRTPFGVGSIRKCLTRSASGSSERKI